MRRKIFLYILLLFCLPATAQVHIDTSIGIITTHGRDYKEMTHILCDGVRGDYHKANAIYNWITHNIKYDIDAVQKGRLKPADVNKVYKSKLAVCDGYAKLYTAMCIEAGIKAISIEGYAKDWIFDNGDILTIPRHMWCAVLVNAQWQLVDPTWGAGKIVQAPSAIRKIIDKVTFRKVTYAQRLKFQFKYDTTYFLQDPLAFRFKHLPSDPCWQLADSAMPLVVFEAGDSAITLFNDRYGQLKTNSGDLMRISSLDEDSVKYEAADRAYTFNSRFPVALAYKQLGKADADVMQVLKEQNPEKGEALWHDAEKRLKIAEAHVKAQKKFFPDQYNTLKKKNRTKNTEAKQQMMQIATDNKKLLAQCNKYKRNADNKNNKNRKKYADAQRRAKGLNVAKINNLEPAKQQKPASAPEMRTITDSIAARNARIGALEKQIAERTALIKIRQQDNLKRLDSLATALGRADSFLVGEAKARMAMQDNYDDEVIMWSSLYKGEKYLLADTLQRYYAITYDSVLAMNDDRYKVYTMMLDAYKNNLRDIEKYAKNNSSDTVVTDKYGDMVTAYKATIDSCCADLQQMINYIQQNKKLFTGLSKLYQRQLKITGYMKKVEDIRKTLEMNYIARKQELDNKENKEQEASLRAAVKTMQKVYK